MVAKYFYEKYFVKKKNSQSGLSTLEMLIAMTLIVLVIGSVLPLVSVGQSTSIDSQTNQEALYGAKTFLEDARASAKSDFGAVITFLSPVLDDIYTKRITVDPASITQCGKNVESNVWIDSRLTTASLITRLSDLQTSLALGGDCDVSPSAGGWTLPNSLISEDINPSGSSATDVDVKNKIAYITADPSNETDHDFFIFDVSNVTATIKPTIIKSIDTGLPTCAPSKKADCGPGLNAVDVAGNYAYVANRSKNAQLQIIDISTPSSAYVKKSYKLPGAYTDQTTGISIFYYNSRVYLGTNKSAREEFSVIDVSNPILPQEIGKYEVNAGMNAIYVKGNYAYIATPNSEELTIIDVNEASPNFMRRVGGLDLPDNSANGKSIFIVGNKLYLGRTVGSGSGKEFYILDITIPITPIILGFYDVNSSVNDLVVVGKYAFLATSESNLEFQVLNVLNANAPTLLGKYNYSEKATGIDFENNFIYVSSESQDALRVIRPAECADKLDDDGDGKIDATDPQCYLNGIYNPEDDNEN